MKRIISIIMLVVFVFSVPAAVTEASPDTSDNGNSENRIVIEKIKPENPDKLAEDYLLLMKKQFSENPYALGFVGDELSDCRLGKVFVLYVFSDDGRITSQNSFVYPIIYGDKIIAVLEMYYDSITSQYYYTFGKAYAEDLNVAVLNSDIDTNKKLVLGRVGNRLFVTDGKEVETVQKIPLSQEDSISSEKLDEICKLIPKNLGNEFSITDDVTIMDQEECGKLPYVEKQSSLKKYTIIPEYLGHFPNVFVSVLV